jgi:lycopene cyclase domain-containing protein
MSYTQLSIFAVLVALLADIQLTRSRMIFRKSFWTSYAIILPFQLLTNWWLTSRNIVIYDSHQIIGWRIASAPVEDLLFGFALVLAILQSWSFWGRKI